MVVVLVYSSKTFRVDNNNINLISIWIHPGQRSPPDPNAFRARVNGWTHTEAALSVQQNSVKQVALACPIHASHRHHTQRSLDLLHHLNDIRIDNKF